MLDGSCCRQDQERGMTYEEICKEQCEWCREGTPMCDIVPQSHQYSVENSVVVTGVSVPCTAPTRDEWEAELVAEIYELKASIAAPAVLGPVLVEETERADKAEAELSRAQAALERANAALRALPDSPRTQDGLIALAAAMSQFRFDHAAALEAARAADPRAAARATGVRG
jgi:hypothetical protein